MSGSVEDLGQQNVAKNFILPGGNVFAKSEGNGNDMLISGYASTKGLDLSREVVEPQSVLKHLDVYKRAGRMWWNHSSSQPIGKVLEIDVDENGIRIDTAKLTDIEFNRKWLYPLIKDGAVSEFSIQFQSLKGEYRKGVYVHTDIYLIECSVVSVACNPEAVITGVKSLVPYDKWMADNIVDIAAMKRLVDEGGIELDTKKVFQMSGLKEEEKMDTKTPPSIQDTPVAPDFSDVRVHDLSLNSDWEGEPIALSKANPNYSEIAKQMHLAQSESRGSFLFQIGDATEKGVKYDFDKVAVSLLTILGGRGSANFMPEDERMKALSNIKELYLLLGKSFPMYGDVNIFDLSPKIVKSLRLKNIKFAHDEQTVFSKSIFSGNVENVKNYLQSVSEDKDLLTEALNSLKGVYGDVSVSFYAYPRSAEDFDFVMNLINQYQTYLLGEADEEASELRSFEEFLKTVNFEKQTDPGDEQPEPAQEPTEEEPTKEEPTADGEEEPNEVDEPEEGVEDDEGVTEDPEVEKALREAFGIEKDYSEDELLDEISKILE
jgi:HK97 family phage prohead protease